MTRRSYWENPYQSEFEATVLEAWHAEGKHFAILDHTLFYPTSGGQLHDTGTLGEARVLDVFEPTKHGEAIVHVVDRPLAAGTRVRGKIDWPRRYRHMQRHTAQHILSQAFLRAGRWNTVAVSLKNPVFTIDFDLPPDEAVIKRAEALANWAVYANLEIRARLVEESQVPLLPLRRLPKVRGTVRVVEIEDWDLAPCGGTHLRRTAEAGPIKILGFERGKKNTTRVYAVAGWEALEDYAAKHEALKSLALKFSSQPLEVPARVEKLERERFEARGEALKLREKLAELIEAKLAAHGQTIAAEVPLEVLNELGKRLATRPGTLALLASPQPPKARLLLVKHPDRPENLKTIWERLRALGARGGGKERYQGVIDLEKLKDALQTLAPDQGS